MVSYSVSIKSSAGKELAAVDSKSARQRIITKISALASNPRPRGSEKLAGYADRYRVRQGNFRIIYHVNDQLREVTIYKVAD